MINLLPSDQKNEILAGRSNSLLMRYVFFIMIAIAIMGLILAFGYFSLSHLKTSAQTVISENNRKVVNYKKVEASAAAFKSDLSVAKSIFSKQYDYSGTILKVAALLPEGTIASALMLDPTSFTKPTQISFKAKTYDSALKLKDNLLGSPLFSDAHFVSITQGQPSAQEPYPLTVNMTVQFKGGLPQ